jgi:diguanylate cyclase
MTESNSNSNDKELESKSSGLLSLPAAFIKKLYTNNEGSLENTVSNSSSVVDSESISKSIKNNVKDVESDLQDDESIVDEVNEEVREITKSLVSLIHSAQTIFSGNDAFGSVRNMADEITDLSESNHVLFSFVNVLNKVSKKYVIEPHENIFDLPLEILKKFKFTKDYQGKRTSLKKRCEGIKTIKEFDACLSDLYELFYVVYQDVYSDKEELEKFLLNIGSQVIHIGEKLHNVAEEQASDLKVQGALNERMSDAVTLINDNISSGNDLISLKNIVKVQLDTLQNIVEEERQIVEAQEKRVNENVKDLVKQVSDLKQEAQELRERVQREKEQALHDSLTGLYNRQAYNEKISEVISMIDCFDNYTLLIWDIDHFKKFNDQYGHVVGDKVLKTVSDKFNSLLKESYFLARFGGEEFAMLIPELTIDQSKEYAENIRNEVSEITFMVKGKQVNITVSCGVSSIQAKDNAQSIFERADKALYRAKADGRNKVKVYKSE